jgi:hypothetical protein
LRLADAVDAAAPVAFCRKIKQPVLEAGRTQVGDEDLSFLEKASSTPFGRAITWAAHQVSDLLATCPSVHGGPNRADVPADDGRDVRLPI